MSPKYNRVLLKLSGEALVGSGEHGIDPETLRWIASEIQDASSLGVQIAIVLGGGNIFRGQRSPEYGIDRCSGDVMGMLGTVINGIALQAALEQKGLEARLMTAIRMQEVAEPYIRPKALKYLREGKVVVLTCGTGSPFFTTDSAGALRALELKADVLMKATDVDGVYSANPAIDENAKRYEAISYKDYLLSGLAVMDWTAVSLCRAARLPILVFNLLREGNIRKALNGEEVGTLVGEGNHA